ncbi:hypothetical protein [Yersinia canariae]|uniref:hypothetical protein n=1 Tax=Yersinia canariae TaxID=2607663 RepID=UPI0011A14A63|nr:hypothetical protein [Yersinia canariae]
MKKPIIALSILVMSGCMSTPQESRRELPLVDEISSKPVNEVAVCIAEQWENNRFLMEYDNTVHTESRNGTTTVYAWKNAVFADVKPNDNGTSVKMFSSITGGMLPGNRASLLKNCL